MADDNPTPVPEMVERVARIIDPEAFGLPLPDRSGEIGGYLTDRDEARARAVDVLKAMRELTAAMLRPAGCLDNGYAMTVTEDVAKEVWQVMIGAALGK